MISVSEFRVFLRNYIYDQNLTLLISYIQQFMETKEISPYLSETKIVIKLKKSKSKKAKENFANNYYDQLNDIFYHFIINPDVNKDIRSSINTFEEERREPLRVTYLDLVNGTNVPMLYNATAIKQDEIIVYL